MERYVVSIYQSNNTRTVAREIVGSAHYAGVVVTRELLRGNCATVRVMREDEELKAFDKREGVMPPEQRRGHRKGEGRINQRSKDR